MSITSKLLLTIPFCSAQQAKYSRHKQLIMIYTLLADLYKTVKIHHDNTEVKQSNVVLMYSSSIQLLQLGQIQVGRPEFWIQNFEIRRWREMVTVATASCVRAYENLDLHSSPVLPATACYTWHQTSIRNLEDAQFFINLHIQVYPCHHVLECR